MRKISFFVEPVGRDSQKAHFYQVIKETNQFVTVKEVNTEVSNVPLEDGNSLLRTKPLENDFKNTKEIRRKKRNFSTREPEIFIELDESGYRTAHAFYPEDWPYYDAYIYPDSYML